MSESDVLRIADKHGQRWKAPDEEGISFEKSAFFEFAEELLASRDAEVQRLREALELVTDCSSQEWQQADGKRMAATDNQGRRFWFITEDVMGAARAALKEQQ